MIKMCLDIPDSFALLSKNKNGGYKVIWVLSILHFVIVFLINDRMIANKRRQLLKLFKCESGYISFGKKRMERIQKAPGIRK